MIRNFLQLIFILIISSACNFESSEEESGGGLFSNHKEVTNIFTLGVPSANTYLANENIDLTLTHPFAVTVSGNPRLTIDVDGSTVYADYLTGSGTQVLTFRYTVANGDDDSDGVLIDTSIDLNGGTITYSENGVITNANPDFAAVTTNQINVDTSSPSVTLVTPPNPDTYLSGESLQFAVIFDETVRVSGTPRIQLDIGGSTVYATYQSGDNSTTLMFRYIVQDGDNDADGIESISPVQLNGGQINDNNGNTANLTFTPIPMPTTYVDGDSPFVSQVLPPTNGTYTAGDLISFSLEFSKVVNVTGTPRVEVDMGGVSVYFEYASGTGTNTLVFDYLVIPDDEDPNGIEISDLIELNGGTIQDGSANDAILDMASPLSPGVLVDADVPIVTAITVPADNTYNLGEDLFFTVTFDRIVDITGLPRVPISLSSSAPGFVYANYASGSGSTAIVFRYNVQNSDLDLDGITLQNALELNSGSIQSSMGIDANLDITTIVAGLTTTGILIDAAVPTVVSITNPADGDYLTGNDIDLTLTFSKSVTVTNTPRIQLDIGGSTVYASYNSGSGSTNLVFRYNVQALDMDLDGIEISGTSIDLNITGTIQDVYTNNANLDITSEISAMPAVLVNPGVPTIAITSPTDLSYINIANDSSTFAISGTCDEATYTATIEVDGSPAASPVNFLCDGTNFSGTIDTTGLAEGVHTIEAKLDNGSQEGTSNTVNVTKDITAPVISSVTPPTNNWYLDTQNLDFVVNLDDNVTVTGTPRIQLDIGGSTVYANYLSGDGTSNLTFRYTVTTGDLDEDGIGFGSTVIDENSGTLADVAGNTINLNMDATIALPSLASVFVDAIIPTVTITSAADITAANEASYIVSGTCSEDGRVVTIDIDTISVTPTCSSGAWTTGAIDVSARPDNPSFPITADHNDQAGNNAAQASVTVNKDTATPMVAITLAQDITSANETSYTLSGTCTENGILVDVNIGALNFQPNCSGGTWSTGYIDVSSLVDNAAISVTADHSTATQASTTVAKDTASPVVTISSAPNITQSNETSYIASGTCSENTVMVDINIGALNFTPTCSGGSWTTGSVDVSSLADSASISFTADHSTAPQASTTISKNTSTPTVTSLSVSATLTNSADISWSLNDPGGFTIDDYDINYRQSGTSTWLSFNDGIDTNTNSTVDGLLASTTYEFRVRVQYDTSNYSDWSNTASGETKPDDPLFSSPYAAMNVGGSTQTNVTAYYDNTIVTLNGTPIPDSPLSKGQVSTITTSQFDIIDADQPIYIAGRRGSGGNTAKANIVWQPASWAGKSFSFNSTRNNPQQLHVFATEDATITVKQGSTTVASGSATAGNGTVISWSVYGSYQVTSTGTILAYHSSGDPNTTLVDPKPLLPSSNEIIGFPSSSMRITADLDATNYNVLHSNSVTANGSLDKQDVIQINPQGTSSLFQGDSLLLSADRNIAGASFADSNGNCAAPFLPTNLMRKNYIINTNSDFVAFASKQAGTIEVYSPTQTIGVDTPVSTLTLTRTGANSNAPFRARIGTTTEGYRFISDVPMAGWYQPNNDTGSADQDETILYGTDD